MTALSVSIHSLAEVPLYQRALAEAGMRVPAPFVEIAWDNFCHLDAYELADVLAPLSSRVSFHVHQSKFIERTAEQFDAFLRRLAEHVRVVRPDRVSDHLARFRLGRLNIALPLEHDYRSLSRVCERVRYYQDRIGQQLLIENFGSTSLHGRRQVAFVHELLGRSGCDLLFDVSNAVVAELNGILDFATWLPLLEGRRLDCHVGGYRLGRGGDLYHDSHDSPVSQRTLAALRRVARVARIDTICYERDYNRTAEDMATDIGNIERALGDGRRPPVKSTVSTPMMEVRP